MTRRFIRLPIVCGDTTCASEPGVFCRNVWKNHLGTRWLCDSFGGAELHEGDDGWLQRLPECLAAEVKS
jgi:hypothetical protein